MKKVALVVLICLGLISTTAPHSRAQVITQLMTDFVAQSPSIMIDLGTGPMNTGPITVSLQSGTTGLVFFDVAARTMELSLPLQFTFPLLSTIGSPPPTMTVREIGPITWGINQTTGGLEAWANLGGGGFIDPGTVFAGGLFANDNNYEYNSTTQRPPLPYTPPSPYGPPFNPYPPNPPPNPPGLPQPPFGPYFIPSNRDLEDRLPTTGPINFIYDGIFRFPGQAGDIRITGSGTATIVIPEPSTLALFGTGALGLIGYGWRRRKQMV